MWLLLAFLAVPLIEIALFIQVGGAIGLFPTLSVVILTAIAGSILVRSQGGEALQRLQTSMERMEDPSSPLADGAMILFAGALLLTPGFFTDVVGFALLVPASRAVIKRAVADRIKRKMRADQARRPSQHGQTGQPGHRGPAPEHDVIEAEYEEVTPHKGDSGWTRP